MNVILTSWWGISFMHSDTHISSDLNPPKLEFHRAKIPSVQLTNQPSKFNEVEWPHPSQLRRPFPIKNFSQTFKNIVSTSG
jgi:hypothetical protein